MTMDGMTTRMRHRVGRVSAGRTLQGAGLMCMGLALLGASFKEARAAVQFVARIAASPAPAPTPAATATPAPAATPAVRYRNGGRLDFALTGSAGLGTHATQFTQAAQPPSQPGAAAAPGFSSSTNSTNENLGLMAELTRRTATTTTDFRFPFGFSNNGTTLGTSVFTYGTPKYQLGYGSETMSAFGQIVVGGSLRGPSMILPFGNGDITVFEGPTFGVNLETIRTTAVRARRLVGRNLLEGGLEVGSSGQQTGSSATALLGLGTSRGHSSFVGEAAFQRRAAPDENLAGTAFQGRFDQGLGNSGFTLAVRHLPQRFMTYGGGETFGDSFLDANLRRAIHGSGQLTLDNSLERSDFEGEQTVSQRSTFGLSGEVRHVSLGLTFQSQRLGGSAPSQWAGSGGLQVGFASRHGFNLVSAQLSRSTQQLGNSVGALSLTAQLQRQLGPFVAQVTGQSLRQSGGALGVTSQIAQSASLSRLFGKTSVGFTYGATRTLSPVSHALQRTPLLTVSRQISPVIQAQASYGTQALLDPLNPGSNGHSRIFSVTLNAPFAFGNGVVQGRADPRLPAIIRGQVITDIGDQSAQIGLATGGVGNVVVVLDGRDAQRTDLAGNFQFSFVTPGQHAVTIETTSIPHGLTVDQPVASVTVQGGQSAQVLFRVGTFGAVYGHLYGTNPGGGQLPLPNVVLRVDSGAFAKTDQQGAYGFGRLAPGTHTITVEPETVPAFANFAADKLKATAVVRNGAITTLDFIAQPLGSIAGKLFYDASLAPDYAGPVTNAYVVAEPGEHAAITDEDGSFIIDNLPPGTYTVAVDEETVPDQTGPLDPPFTVDLTPQEHYEGLAFRIGHKIKKVVFTFQQQGSTTEQSSSIELSESRLPPLGTTDVRVDAPNAKGVAIDAFGKPAATHYDQRRKQWVATIEVPPGTKAGKFTVVASIEGDTPSSKSATLTVDPNVPIAILQATPANALAGQYVVVRARFLVDAREGDKIQWQDGSTTVLGKPLAGRVFTFGLRLSLRPLHGLLLTHTSRLPIHLL